MEAPHVDPVGVSCTPPGYRIGPRTYSRMQRFVAGTLVAVFTGVVVLTTAWSLGAYCLTSDGENTRSLPYRARVIRPPACPLPLRDRNVAWLRDATRSSQRRTAT